VRIHISSCPKHPSQIGQTTLVDCYCRVNREATLSELLYELADDVASNPNGSNYGRALLDAIRKEYANAGLHELGCRCPECDPDHNSAEAIARDEARTQGAP